MRTILIVEDEPLEQEFLKTIVLDELHPDDVLLMCDSGVTAIQLAKEHKPDLILMDLLISEKDGLTAIQEIRKFLPQACISILSACSDFTYAQKAIKFQVFEYLLKPVKPTVLKEVFTRMLDCVGSHCATLADEKVEMPRAETKDERLYFIEESIKYIKEHFKERLTLEMVASKVFVNPKYFSHVFKKEVGVAFTEYVINLRVEYACKLLETTNHPAYRISFECGFSDPSYFNRVFCAQMNMTPQTFRKLASSTKIPPK